MKLIFYIKYLIAIKYIKNKKKCIIIFIIWNLIIYSLNNKSAKHNKICLCVIAKQENRYIKEFIEHYKKYGIDKIYIYDNNDMDGEKFEYSINNYIKNGFVELINYKGIEIPQLKAYNDCYRRFNKLYDWLIFFDVDEFIYLKNFTSFKSFLNLKKFEKCNRVQFNWIFYTDNNLLYYEDKPLQERFTEREPKARGKMKNINSMVKSAIRGNMNNIIITCPHALSNIVRGCDSFGNRKKFKSYTDKVDFVYYYIKHYSCKSTEEFIKNKLKKTDVFYKENYTLHRIKSYFEYNKITEAKIALIENETKYNLKFLRNRIESNTNFKRYLYF